MNPLKVCKSLKAHQRSPRASNLFVLARNHFVRKIIVLVINRELNADLDANVLAAKIRCSSQGV